MITNTNTGRKCSMIEHIMQSMQFPAELIEKGLRYNLTPCIRRTRQWQITAVQDNLHNKAI
ncbi:hypothetical protein HR12_06905 [Microbacterium sp. SUBG005]|nr:hypothetical protein HR12_06905 [Microbacterium sp. SUBG005]